MQDIVGRVFASQAVCLHVIRCCMHALALAHVPLVGEKIGDTVSYMSSNRISCLISNNTVKDLFLLTCQSLSSL